MSEVEKSANEYARDRYCDDSTLGYIHAKEDFLAGAKWQMEQFEFLIQAAKNQIQLRPMQTGAALISAMERLKSFDDSSDSEEK